MKEPAKRVRFGIVGMGGYAQNIIKSMLAHGAPANPGLDLVATCDPLESNRAEHGPAMRQAGVTVLSNVDELLRQPIDAVWLPLPIDLHRSFTERAFAAGQHVVCEKPIAGSIDDAAAMIAARDASGRSGLIGFQHVYLPEMHALKRELVGGSFGRLKSITIKALWPRDDRYYERSTWAARYRRNNMWVMDSPANNALAHPIHLCMFLAGAGYRDLAPARSVQVELYRARPIENYDTIAMRAQLATDVELLVLLTHAVDESEGPVIDLRCSNGAVRIYQDRQIERMDQNGGIVDTRPLDAAVPHMMRGVASYLSGDHQGIVGTFEMAQEHLRLLNAASAATIVRTVPQQFVQTVNRPGGGMFYAIKGIKSVFDQCASGHLLPHETRDAPWSVPAGRMDLSGFNHFSGPRVQ